MAEFEPAVELVLSHEGGYVNDASDHGGETKYGISKAQYPSLDIANLTLDQAKAIYQRDYWIYGGLLDQGLANKMLDLAVWLGIRRANRMLQQALGACGRIVVCDGKLGPITLNAANAIPADQLLSTLKQEVAEFLYHLVASDPSQNRFFDGWMNRANA